MTFLTCAHEETLTLPEMGSWPEAKHVVDGDTVWALNAALAAERPLLVRGEPGCGKSQLARLAAHVLGRVLITEVIHARGEAADLQYRFDAVARLGEAQAIGTLKDVKDPRAALHPNRFLAPGPLWWAFDWVSATDQAKICDAGMTPPTPPKRWTPEHGSVLLIDEIDKAETDLPNGLLETLGNGAFHVPYRDKPVGRAKDCPPPLVVITTNEERELPAAFLRRCLVLHLGLERERDALIDWLVARGEAHHGDAVTESVQREAAELLWTDREQALRDGLPAPGQAEYLDLLRALARLGRSAKKQREALERIARFALAKNPEQQTP